MTSKVLGSQMIIARSAIAVTHLDQGRLSLLIYGEGGTPEA